MIRLIFALFFLTSPPLLAQTTLTQEIAAFKSKGSKKTPPEVRAEMKRATEALKASGIEERALKKGSAVPSFKLGDKGFKKFFTKKPVILKFYRGGWCPYCIMELKAYQRLLPDFEKKGYQFIAITPDTDIEIKLTKKRHDISLPIFHDKENEIAKKFGLAFKLDAKIAKIYKGFNIDLKKSQGNDKEELPMPGTFVIDSKGKIIFAYAEADYTKRYDPLVLLNQLSPLTK